jgi:hypothetical protein
MNGYRASNYFDDRFQPIELFRRGNGRYRGMTDFRQAVRSQIYGLTIWLEARSAGSAA